MRTQLAISIFQSITKAPHSLTSLDLTGHNISDSAILHILAYFSSPYFQLQNLNLTWNRISEPGAKILKSCAPPNFRISLCNNYVIITNQTSTTTTTRND